VNTSIPMDAAIGGRDMAAGYGSSNGPLTTVPGTEWRRESNPHCQLGNSILVVFGRYAWCHLVPVDVRIFIIFVLVSAARYR